MSYSKVINVSDLIIVFINITGCPFIFIHHWALYIHIHISFPVKNDGMSARNSYNME
jgi:hypothetical protein